MFGLLQLLSGDNASAELIPGQTTGRHALRVRPVEAGQDLEEVDGLLVCSCCFSGYAWISRRDLWSIAYRNTSMIFNPVL